jgi:hypothetical protein
MYLRKRTGAFKRIVWVMLVVILFEIAVILFLAAHEGDDDLAPVDARGTTRAQQMEAALTSPWGRLQFTYAAQTSTAYATDAILTFAAAPIETQFHYADRTATAAIDRIITTATARVPSATPTP